MTDTADTARAEPTVLQAEEGVVTGGRVKAPVTWKTYMMCAFAAFGGIFFGYDSGYISGVMAMDYFIHEFTGKVKADYIAQGRETEHVLSSLNKSLITSILSAGTFFGAIISGVVAGDNPSIISAQIAFICIYVTFFASTWGPGAWVVIREIYPLPIRSRGVALSTASNWLWNCIITIITPYMVNTDKGNLKSKVFFIRGSLCACAFAYTYFLISKTKGLTLEQVNKLMEETTPRTSAKWKPHTTYAADMGISEKDVTLTVKDVAAGH